MIKILKSFWNKEMKILGNSDWISRSYAKYIAKPNLESDNWLKPWCSLWTPIKTCILQRTTWFNSWLSHFIHIEFPKSTFSYIHMGWSILVWHIFLGIYDGTYTLMMTGMEIIIDRKITFQCFFSLGLSCHFDEKEIGVFSLKRGRGWVHCY